MRWIAVPFLVLGGCTTVEREAPPPPGEGVLEISWQVGSRGCDDAGVVTIEVDVAGALYASPCSEGTLVAEVDEGTWDVVLTGYDDEGIARYTGIHEGVRADGGEVTRVPTIVLGANPGELTVSWYFENGRLCGGNGVVDLDITIFDRDYVVDEIETVCDDGIEDLGPLVAGDYTLLLMARDDSGAARFSGSAEVPVEKGQHLRVEVMLTDF